MIQKRKDLREVYVWQLPVRVFHWVNAFCITVLSISGYFIGSPPAIQHGTAPYYNYWFGILRFVHFAVAMVFIVNFLVRIYWMFAGNNFALIRNYYPFSKKQWRGIFETIKVDVFLITKQPIYDIGHNALAASTYGALFIIMVIQIGRAHV